ncbi:MAG: hypothetical protein ACI8XO_004850 [Verrucomicrobiales bacterium]
MIERRVFLKGLGAAALAVVLVRPAAAIVLDDLSIALEMAFEYVKKGFVVREENWHGKLSVGKKTAVKHQLFKGNEYWFWAGSTTKDVKLRVKIYDKKGRPTDVETKVTDKGAAARILAPKTGTYYIVIEAQPADPKKKKKFKRNAVEWAMAYGFR